jgi:hypothetical protein
MTTANAQETRASIQSIEPQHSVISLAPVPRPQGQLLARNTGDATFARVPANYHVFAASTAGKDADAETLRLNFEAATRLMKIESKTKDFIIESGGTCHEGNNYERGDTCSLSVRFNPQGPGHRVGALHISNTAEATPTFVGLVGNGYAPVVSFTPSQMTTVAGTVSGGTGTIKSSVNLAVDGGDILYIPDFGNNAIKEIDSSGTINTLSSGFGTPVSLVADSGGVLYGLNPSTTSFNFFYFSPNGTQTGYGAAYTPGSCTPSTPCPLETVGLSNPANINIDPSDNLFFEEATMGAAEMPVAGVSAGAVNPDLWYLKNPYVYASGNPASFSVDGSDNLYNYYNSGYGTCLIQEEPLYNAEYSPTFRRVAGGAVCGFSGDGGQARGAEISKTVGQITFDVAGNLYFADAGNQRIRRIDAATGIISTIAGNGVAGYGADGYPATSVSISNPTGLAVDSQGQVYILSNAPTAGPTQVIRKVNTLGYWNYGGQFKGSAGVVKVFTVANTGNDVLTLKSNALISGNPDYSIDPFTTNCVLTAGSTLAAGRSCNIGVKFTPVATGNRIATITLLDDTVTGSNAIQVFGVGVLPAPAIKITSPAAGSSVKSGTTVTFAVSVNSTTATLPTGTVTFKVNGSNIGSAVTLSASGTASTTFTQSSAATYTLAATYSGDANYASVSASESFVVTAVVRAASTVTLAPSPTESAACSPPSYQVRVSSASGGPATGTVQLKSGTSVLATSTLSNGSANLSIRQISPGSYTFLASYQGDSNHLPADSAPSTLKTVRPLVGSCGIHPPINRPTGHL